MAQRQYCQAVDIGGGSGTQSLRMAVLGAAVLLIDLMDQPKAIDDFNRQEGREAIQFIQRDMREIANWPSPVDCIYSQRTLNYLPYEHALQLLITLKSKASTQARLFLSTGGLNTEYGVTYTERDKPVEARFVHLAASMAEKHGIHEPQCLYSESDLRQIVEKAGLTVVRSWTSPFGNPKLIAQNTRD